MAQFSAIPEIPLGGMSDWMYVVLTAMKLDIELLTGTRGVGDTSNAAITQSSININVPAQTIQQITAVGAGYTIQGAQVAALDDHNKLATDVQKAINDITVLHAVVVALVAQLQGK